MSSPPLHPRQNAIGTGPPTAGPPTTAGLDEILDYSATTVTRVAGDTARVQWSDAGPVQRKE